MNKRVRLTFPQHPIKDPDTVSRVARKPIKVDAEVKAIEKALGGIL